jgi:hypothetical protein
MGTNRLRPFSSTSGKQRIGFVWSGLEHRSGQRYQGLRGLNPFRPRVRPE